MFNTTGFSQEGPLELFIHNGIGGIPIYISSVLFAIPSILALFYTAINLGVIGQLFNSLMPNGGLQYNFFPNMSKKN